MAITSFHINILILEIEYLLKNQQFEITKNYLSIIYFYEEIKALVLVNIVNQ